jgi:hypothetical protein
VRKVVYTLSGGPFDGKVFDVLDGVERVSLPHVSALTPGGQPVCTMATYGLRDGKMVYVEADDR